MDSQRDGQEHGVPSESNDAFVSRLAQQDKEPWYKKPNLRFLYLVMAPTCLGVEMTSGFDSTMVNGLQAVPSWLEYYNHPHSASLGLMVSMYALGSVAAVPFVPFTVDKLGRRYPILFGAMLSIVAGLLQGLALNFSMFVIARFMLGFANVFCVVAGSSLIGELSHPKERPVLGCLFNTCSDVGALAAAAITLATFAMPNNWGWRIPSLLQIGPSLLQASFIWFLPESPRWLVSKGRAEEAHAILIKYHAEGDENSEFAKAEYIQIQETLDAELRTARMNRKTLLSTPGMRNRLLIASFLGMTTQWSGNGLIAHYLAPILDTIGIHDNRTKNIINLAKVSWSLVIGGLSAFITPWYPRRAVFLTCAVSILVVFTAWTVASANYASTHNQVSAQVVVALIFLYSPPRNIFITLIYTYLVEILPFRTRAVGITVYQWWCRGAQFFNQFVNPIGLEMAGWRWYLVYCGWNAFQVGFVYLMFPETSGRTLEELAFLYESDRTQEAPESPELEPLLEHGRTGY